VWLSISTLGARGSREKGGRMESIAVKKLPISPTIRALSIGETAIFPIEQSSSVTAVCSKFRKEMARIGWEAEVKYDRRTFTVSVQRTK